MEIKPSEKRAFRRVGFKNPIRFQPTVLNEMEGSLACDISEGGIRFNSSDFIPLNTEILLNVELNENKVIECMGKVVWVNKLPYNDRYQVGVEFTGIDSLVDIRNKIRKEVLSN